MALYLYLYLYLDISIIGARRKGQEQEEGLVQYTVERDGISGCDEGLSAKVGADTDSDAPKRAKCAALVLARPADVLGLLAQAKGFAHDAGTEREEVKEDDLEGEPCAARGERGANLRLELWHGGWRDVFNPANTN